MPLRRDTDVKRKLIYALSRLASEDAGLPIDIQDVIRTLELVPDVIQTVEQSVGEIKPISRRVCVGMLASICETHGDDVSAFVPKILAIIVDLFGNTDAHLRDALCDTLSRIAAVYTPHGAQQLMSLLKPLFQAISSCHDKFGQQGAALGVAAVLSGTESSLLQENLLKVLPRILHHIGLPLVQCRVALLNAVMVLIQASPVDFEPGSTALSMVLPVVDLCCRDSDWQTRYKVVEVGKMIGDGDSDKEKMKDAEDVPWQGSPLQKHVLKYFSPLVMDKVRQVRNAVKQLKVDWEIQETARDRRSSSKDVKSSFEPPPRSEASPSASSAAKRKEAAVAEARESIGLKGYKPKVTPNRQSIFSKANANFFKQPAEDASFVVDDVEEFNCSPGGDLQQSVCLTPYLPGADDLHYEGSQASHTPDKSAQSSVSSKKSIGDAADDLWGPQATTASPAVSSSAPTDGTFASEYGTHGFGPNDAFATRRNLSRSPGGAADSRVRGDDYMDDAHYRNHQRRDERWYAGDQPAHIFSQPKTMHSHSDSLHREAPCASEVPRGAVEATGSLTREVQCLQENVQHLRAALNSSLAQVSELHNMRDEFIGLRQALEAQHKRTQELHHDLRDVQEVQDGKIADLADDIGRHGLTASESRDDGESNGLGMKMRDVEERISQMQSQLAQLAAKIREQDVCSSRMEATLAELAAKGSEGSPDVRAAVDDLVAKEREQQECNSVVEATVTQLTVRLREQEERNSQLETALWELTAKEREHEEHTARLETTLSQLMAKEREQQEHTSRLESTISQLEAKEREQEEHTSRLETTMTHLMAKEGPRQPSRPATESEVTETATLDEDRVETHDRWRSTSEDNGEKSSESDLDGGDIGAKGTMGGRHFGSARGRTRLEWNYAEIQRDRVQVPSRWSGYSGKIDPPADVQLTELRNLCNRGQYLDAYKRALSASDLNVLVDLMRETGASVTEYLDAETNSRMIRRLIHILQSSKSISFDVILQWLLSVIDQRVHFTASQIDDLSGVLRMREKGTPNDCISILLSKLHILKMPSI